ncbi:hypothetical protein MAPG_02080 [Magnaporthiopsis poae ATCC 64411]|uniref:Glutathione S-transferase n=1 Tax=Magnaporthiopsis poae (strain ATCC 64411 / 73-15) TaxID=644358 RepID=A0A0C4DQE0_MAGP6|nr:hypothetical protein MAPG_02080 [Magnaporthiopsis poae ATCC 64411]
MAPFATIYSYPENRRVKSAQVLAAMNGLELNVPTFEFGVANQTPEFLAKFPLGKVPAMETADGLCLTESVAICAHVAASGPLADQLLGKTVAERSQILRWSIYAETEIASHTTPIFLGYVLKLYPGSPAAYDTGVAGYQRAVLALDAALKDGRSFLVGDKLSMADAIIAGAIFFTSTFLLDAEMAKEAPNVVRYMTGLSAIPEIKNVFGEFKPCAARTPKA